MSRFLMSLVRFLNSSGEFRVLKYTSESTETHKWVFSLVNSAVRKITVCEVTDETAVVPSIVSSFYCSYFPA